MKHYIIPAARRITLESAGTLLSTSRFEDPNDGVQAITPTDEEYDGVFNAPSRTWTDDNPFE